MKFGISEKELEILNNMAITVLKDLGANVYIFGSRARGDHHQFSDIDIMVESTSELTKEISQISENLVNSNFPYIVDIVEFKNFSESYKESYLQDRTKL